MSGKKGVFDIKKRREDISKYAPEISFWVASILIVLGEIRVYDVVYKLTSSVFLAVSALSVSGVLFFIWKNNWQYPIATDMQKNISLLGMIASLGIAIWIGGLDYYISSGLLPSNLNGGNTIINTLIYGTAANIVGLLLYWYRDPRVESIRAKYVGDEEFKWLEESTERANTMLDKVIPLMDRYQSMVKRFGKRAADDMLLKAGIDPETFQNIIEALEDKTGKDINKDGRIGAAKPNNPQPARRVEDEARTNGQFPVWKLPDFLNELGITREQAEKVLANTSHHNEGYQALKAHGIEKVSISKENFNNLYYQLRPREKTNPT